MFTVLACRTGRHHHAEPPVVPSLGGEPSEGSTALVGLVRRVQRDDPTLAALLLAETPPAAPGFGAALIQVVHGPPLSFAVFRTGRPIYGVAWSPDGTLALVEW